MGNDWWNKTVVVSYLIQSPTKQNCYTTGYKKLFAIGRGMERRDKKLWYHSVKTLNLKLLEIKINFSPYYYEESIL